jgi:competence protein ComEA
MSLRKEEEEMMTLRRTVLTGLTLVMAALLAAPPVVGAAQAAPTQKVDLNTATVDQLTALPGIGATLAARIVEYREKVGQFRSADELLNVKGIGEKNFQKLEPWLTVSEPPREASR